MPCFGIQEKTFERQRDKFRSTLPVSSTLAHAVTGALCPAYGSIFCGGGVRLGPTQSSADLMVRARPSGVPSA
jgi:hypothetical protein